VNHSRARATVATAGDRRTQAESLIRRDPPLLTREKRQQYELEK